MFKKKMFNHIMVSIWVIPAIVTFVGIILTGIAKVLNNDYVSFFKTFFIHFNGFFVGGSAYILLVFVLTYKRVIILDINSLFGKHCILDEKYLKALKNSQSKIICSIYITIITIIGGVSLYINGYPLTGFCHAAIIISTFSIYSVGGYGLWSFVSIYKLINAVDFCDISESIIGDKRIDKIVLYINISSGLALASLFISFNGTLTANFTYEYFGGNSKFVLLLPIILFIPYLLYYNYYPNIMLKKKYEQSINIELEDLSKSLTVKYPETENTMIIEQILHRHKIYLNEKFSKLTLPTFGNIAVMATALYMAINLIMNIYKLQMPN